MGDTPTIPAPTGSPTATLVVDAAERLLERGGFDALSVRQVGDALGVSRQVVYTHFGGIHGLLDALHVRASSYLAAAVSGVDRPMGTVEHFLAGTAAYLAVARAHEHLYQLMFEQPVPDYRPSLAARRASRASFGHLVLAADAYRRDDPSSVPDDETTWDPAATELARALWTTSHGFVVLERVGYASARDTDRLVETTIRALLAGW